MPDGDQMPGEWIHMNRTGVTKILNLNIRGDDQDTIVGTLSNGRMDDRIWQSMGIQ